MQRCKYTLRCAMSVEENGRGGRLWRKEEEPLVLWLTYEKAGEKQLRALGSISLYTFLFTCIGVCVCVCYKGALLARFLHAKRDVGGGQVGLGVNMIYVIRLIKRLSELRKTFEGREERWFQTWYYRAPFCLEYRIEEWRRVFELLVESSVLTFDLKIRFHFE